MLLPVNQKDWYSYRRQVKMSIASVIPLLLWANLIIIAAAQGCKFGEGEGCLYKCNCNVTCDAQTGCQGNCSRGWDGPTCQRQNVALNQTTRQSTSFEMNTGDPNKGDPKFAVDGILGHSFEGTPCTHTDREDISPWWEVTLDKIYPIYRFQIYNRNGVEDEKELGARLNGFWLSVGNSSENNVACYKDGGSVGAKYGPGNIITGRCENGSAIAGNTVNISISGSEPYLTLCEVQLFVCSDGWYGEICERECKTNINCSRCDNDRIRCEECVVGRWGKDCLKDCGPCWNNNPCNKLTGECPDDTRRCEAGFHGAKCTQPCSPGTWGADCNRTCGGCYVTNACNRTSGDCFLVSQSPRCKIGHTGTRCEPCANGMWGADCNRTCGCHDGNACITTSGYCPLIPGNPRCKIGYTGDSCEACQSGSWGENCTQNCSATCVDVYCNVTTGACLRGCKTGYSGEGCEHEFREGTTGGPGSTGPSVAGIAGGAGAGGAVLVVLIMVVIVVVVRRRRKRNALNGNEQELRETATKGPVAVEIHNEEPEENQGYHTDDDASEAGEVVGETSYEIDEAPSTVVTLDKFREYVARMKAIGGLNKEFEKFPSGLHAKHDVADKPVNKYKSRYKSLVAYDHSRVILSTLGNPDEDYINASYINGYNEPKKFIASQGPTDIIINDFMRMIWEQKCGKVVMVTNLVEKKRTKSEQYWPTEGTKKCGVIGVTVLDEETFPDITIRTLELTHVKVKNRSRVVKHFQFTSWPDHGAPDRADGLLTFREKVLDWQTSLNGPILVHCSAGIGRTGTFIALDYLINQAVAEGKVDVRACVNLLRQQRVNMVQSQEQYRFLHEALVEALDLADGSVTSADFPSVFRDLCTPNPDTGNLKFYDYFQALQDSTTDIEEANLVTARKPENREKNRSEEIVAADRCRPFLSTPTADGTNYINAVFLPGYKANRGFILTHTPLPHTVVDFWRLVYDHGVSTIVMLDTEESYETVGIYWPDTRKKFDRFRVEKADGEEGPEVSVMTYQLSKDGDPARDIKQFRCRFWPGQISPKSIPSLLTVIQSVALWKETLDDKTVLVHCRDGVTYSGLFCVIFAVMERLKIDQDINITDTIRQMRVNRPEIITDMVQFKFVHEVAMEYLENFKTYANFD